MTRPTDGLRVLLAEDHPVNQKVAVRMLERLGHSVVVAPDGREAIAALEAGGFDVRPHGRADAGDGRLRGSPGHSRARGHGPDSTCRSSP